MIAQKAGRRIDPARPEPTVVELAAMTVLRGGVVLAPTDTVYGLHCHPFQPSALEKLAAVKSRPEGKGFLLLIPETGWTEELSPSRPANFEAFAKRIWPGPVTVLLHGQPSLSQLILGSQGKVGCRVPASPFLHEWMREISAPLVSTSANPAGRPIPSTLAELRSLFLDRVELFLQAEEPADAPASTVVDLTMAPPQIVRHGAADQPVERALRTLS